MVQETGRTNLPPRCPLTAANDTFHTFDRYFSDEPAVEFASCLQTFQLQNCRNTSCSALIRIDAIITSIIDSYEPITQTDAKQEPIETNFWKMRMNQARLLMETVVRIHVWKGLIFLDSLQEIIVLYYRWQLVQSLKMFTIHYEMLSKSVITAVKLGLEYYQTAQNMSAVAILGKFCNWD